MTRLVAERLTADAFAPFGAVVERPGRDPDAEGPGWTWWGETELLAPVDGGYGIGYLDLVPGPAGFDWAERHMASQELIAPLVGACLVYAGPADRPEEPAALPELDRFRVFRVEPGQAVMLAAGVWHGAPLADGGPGRAMVALRTGTARGDTVVVRFADRAVRIEGVAHADR